MSSITPDETILGILAVRARHGYELMDCFRDPTQLGEVWRLSTSQLYAVLKRLEAQGLTEGREIIVPDAPPRTEYALTSLGEARLDAWLHEPFPSASVHRVRVEFLSRLYVARWLDIKPTSTAWRNIRRGTCCPEISTASSSNGTWRPAKTSAILTPRTFGILPRRPCR